MFPTRREALAAPLALYLSFLDGEGGEGTFEVLSRMCRGIQETLTYAMRFEPGTQPPATTLETGGGTCRDYALLMMEGARALGLRA